MYKFRNTLASYSRSMPYFRGKFRLGRGISRLLSNYDIDQECITTIRMKDGSLMKIDIRSATEQWSYWSGDYDQDIISRLSSTLKEDCVVLDVGANIGYYSVALGNRAKKLHGLVYAFEPVTSNFNRLIANIELNGLKEVVLAQKIALGNEEGSVVMTMASDNKSVTGNAVMVKGEIQSDYFEVTNEVRLTRLDALAEEQQIKVCHLIKVDIEGAEVMFLQGGKSFLAQNRPIVYGEFNNYFLPKFGHSFLDVVEIFKPLNYRFFQQTKDGYFHELVEPKKDSEHMLLVPAEISTSTLAKLGVH